MEGVNTPAGSAGQVRSRRSSSDKEAYCPPSGSETPGTEVNSPFLQQDKTKKDVTTPIFIALNGIIFFNGMALWRPPQP
jgi:hypothetical protein